MHNINRPKKTPMILSNNTEKVFDKVKHPFMTKNSILETEGAQYCESQQKAIKQEKEIKDIQVEKK